MNSKMGALICLLGLSLMGCGEASPQPAENERNTLESVEITEEEPQNEPEELLVAVDNPAYFEDAVENFEREYPQYRIILLTPEDGEDSAQFHTRIRAEIESGQGPDILEDFFIDALAYAEAGYIQPWGEIFTAAEQEQLLPGVLDTGRIKDKLYGIPYKCYRRTLVTSKSRIGDAEKPDLNQLMQLVEESGAERLASRLSPSWIFELCVLSDKEDNTFIDWENGTCDFTGDDFQKVLRFARTYGDREYIVVNERKVRRLKKGEDFAEDGLQYLEDICLYEAVLEGEDVYIGFPGRTGGRTIVSTSQLFLNGASVQKETAASFLRYLLSEEQQNRMMESQMADPHTDVQCNSVRVDTTEYCLAAERQQNQEFTRTFYEIAGIQYVKNGITERQEQQFRGLMDNISYEDLYLEGLMREIYTDDALQDYWDGNITEAEAARALQAVVEGYFTRIKALGLK